MNDIPTVLQRSNKNLIPRQKRTLRYSAFMYFFPFSIMFIPQTFWALSGWSKSTVESQTSNKNSTVETCFLVLLQQFAAESGAFRLGKNRDWNTLTDLQLLIIQTE